MNLEYYEDLSWFCINCEHFEVSCKKHQPVLVNRLVYDYMRIFPSSSGCFGKMIRKSMMDMAME